MMKRATQWILIGLVVVLWMNGGVLWAASLWSQQSTSLYMPEPKVYRVGDLLTILILEQAKATQEAQSSNSENSGLKSGVGSGVLQSLFPSVISAEWDSDFKGKGATSQSGSLKAEMTVQIKEVNPNGLLVFEGRKVIKVNKEEQMLIITGMVRDKDIMEDNVVLSSRVANMVIEFPGKGVVSETQNPGILLQLWHFLF